jgi:AGZA family xanthine/uracil permease-like MFS transporter
VACLGSGLIEAAGAFSAQLLRRWLPGAALLSTLAGIALGYIALGFLLRTYAQPVVGLTVLAVILVTYYGKLRLPIPGGLLAVLVGMVLAWGLGLIRLDTVLWQQQLGQVGLRPPQLELAALWQARGQLMPWLGVIVPMELFNLLGSLQNIESAEAAGDRYPVRSSLLINGLGTIAAAGLGGCFPTTLYIGHPAWKAMGARIGYSWLNGLVMGGAFALEQGQIITAMLLAAMVVYVIEQRFLAASVCAAVAATCSWLGVIHAWRFTTSDTVLELGLGVGSSWALGYLLMALVFSLAHLQHRRNP